MTDQTTTGLLPSQTLLILLESLANRVLQTGSAGKKFRLAAIHLTGESITLALELSGMAGPLNGRYQLALSPRESTPETTRCDFTLGSDGILGKLVKHGEKLIPRPLLNEALLHFFGEGLRIEGDQVMIDHAALVRTLLSGKPKKDDRVD